MGGGGAIASSVAGDMPMAVNHSGGGRRLETEVYSRPNFMDSDEFPADTVCPNLLGRGGVFWATPTTFGT